MNTNDIERTYRGVQFQTNWRPRRFNIGLNYTWSELRGNDEQETATSGTVGNYPSGVYYPELTSYANYQPVGWLTGDQRHRARGETHLPDDEQHPAYLERRPRGRRKTPKDL